VLAITSEYSTRMIRTTLAAAPRRRRALVGKIAVVTAVVLPIGLATSVACFLLGQAILRGNGFTYENGYPAASLVDSEPLRAVAGSGLYLGLLAVFSLSVGAILRHTAGAVTAVLALVIGPVTAFNLLPERAADVIEHASLLAAGIAMQQTVEVGRDSARAVAGARGRRRVDGRGAAAGALADRTARRLDHGKSLEKRLPGFARALPDAPKRRLRRKGWQ
jgi:ABC-2 type transport system permease protein